MKGRISITSIVTVGRLIFFSLSLSFAFRRPKFVKTLDATENEKFSRISFFFNVVNKSFMNQFRFLSRLFRPIRFEKDKIMLT